jgi:hypothetical protein
LSFPVSEDPSALVFELQSHSVYSDGELPPREVVSRAAADGVQLLSLTDHDSVDGVAEAREAAGAAGLAFAAAVEVSTLDPNAADLHILGYLIDIEKADLLEWLANSRGDREARAERMIDALRKLGYSLDETVLHARSSEGKAIGRPHLAAAVVADPGNAQRLGREGLTDPSAFLVANLIEGKPAFSPRRAPSAAEAIEMIHAAGGVAVWAHPFWDIADPSDVLAALKRFAEAGIDGVEAFYATHTREQTSLLTASAADLGLLTTGSSDYHGPGHRQFNRFRAFETFGHRPQLGPIEGSRSDPEYGP